MGELGHRLSVALPSFLSLFPPASPLTLSPHPSADVKDDSCSECPGYDDDAIYHRMWQAIQDSGRSMVLTVEGKPTDSIISLGGYGNAKRVGHDISPQWASMTSLVDIGSGLWMYAHNSTNATFGGWWSACGRGGSGGRACAARATQVAHSPPALFPPLPCPPRCREQMTWT